MATVQFLQFKETIGSGDKLENAAKSLRGIEGVQGLTIGSPVQDPSILQVTAKWGDFQTYEALEGNSGYQSFMSTVRGTFGEPVENFHAALTPAGSEPNGLGPEDANVVEFVQNWFPVSRLTPEYRKQVEAEFQKFDDIFVKGVTGGDKGWRTGWSLEDKDHENDKGEKVRCFCVVRGWDSFEDFEHGTQTDAFKEAIPILHAWGAQFKMVSIPQSIDRN